MPLNEVKKIQLDSILEFEIEAYRAESELATQKFKAESELIAIRSSRTWRYTSYLRSFINFLMKPLLQSKRGLKFLVWVSKALR